MKNETTNTCGIDVSKDTLDCCYGTEDGREVHLKVSNDEKGFRQLYKECGRRKYVMETTGPYYLRLALWLKEKQCSVCVENALVIKRFIQMNQERSKNDKKDARWIFHYTHAQTFSYAFSKGAASYQPLTSATILASGSKWNARV